jgi:hypothetical protein
MEAAECLNRNGVTEVSAIAAAISVIIKEEGKQQL